MLAAYALEQSDPQQALAHAQWVAHQASRVDIARETLGLVAYRQGKWKLANRELRTAYRMNGESDYLPIIADCERGMGHPEKAIEIALSDDAKKLKGEAKAEMMIVFAGAYADRKHYDQALKIIRTLENVPGLSGGYRMRALQAEQNFLDAAGRIDESKKLDEKADELESEFADKPEEEDPAGNLQDTDLENLTPDDNENLESALGVDFQQLADEENADSNTSDSGASDSDESDSGTPEAGASDSDASSDKSDDSAQSRGKETPSGTIPIEDDDSHDSDGAEEK